MKIGKIDTTDKIFTIAEIGNNHEGDLDLALEMVQMAAEAGADAVKFQTFSAERLVTPGTKKARYHAVNTPAEESHYEMINKLELGQKEHKFLWHENTFLFRYSCM